MPPSKPLLHAIISLLMNGSHVTIYQGWRDDKGITVVVNDRPLRHVAWHSPDGFEWGYAGSGPADLALSILAHYFKETYLNTHYIKKHGTQKSKAWKYHQPFKFAEGVS